MEGMEGHADCPHVHDGDWEEAVGPDARDILFAMPLLHFGLSREYGGQRQSWTDRVPLAVR